MSGTDLPCVVFWGPDLGELDEDDLLGVLETLAVGGDGIDPHPWLAVLPRPTAGWLGRPGLRGSRKGRQWSPTYTHVDHRVDAWPGGLRVESIATDTLARLEVTSQLELLTSGLVRLRAIVRNLDAGVYTVAAVEPGLPVPADADELLDMQGRPGHERTPQRHPFDQGLWARESWGGRPGHDSATIMAAGRAGFGFRRGRVWAVHLAWSGNQVLAAESSFTGWKVLRGGEILEPHEVELEQGASYASPWLYASWGEGLDELSARFHDHLRSRTQHPVEPRPVVLNPWEAFYFDVDSARLIELAEHAAGLGVERFVLDDGWFQGRRDDRRALGDWVVDRDVFPDGLAPIADAVHRLGMDFGLWFEPEMLSPDSDLAREHPDWFLGTDAGPGIASRHQHVLDLTNDAAWTHLVETISSLVDQYDIAYIKWDHNRPLLAAGRGIDHTPGVHEQTLAVYRLMAELRRRHPRLEIEACAGGGARLDLGIMEHAHRAWVSDCVDPNERHRLVRWTSIVLPLELLGTHVAAEADHTTGRRTSIAFRAGTAVWGHLGIEHDVRSLSDDDRDELRSWIAFYTQFRGLLHSGRLIRADDVDPSLQLDGVVAQDGSEALFRLSMLSLSLQRPAGRVRFPGLEQDSRYHVQLLSPAMSQLRAPNPSPEVRDLPRWFDKGVTLPGRVLEEVGIMAPFLLPDQLIYIQCRRVDP